ncbi:hypothetical protein M8J75_013516 [Diaphorina citri]|nr:hypothetical protein M8J75_013516 [Diaphorina citri]
MKSVADLLPGASGICRFYHADKCTTRELLLTHSLGETADKAALDRLYFCEDKQFQAATPVCSVDNIIELLESSPKTKLENCLHLQLYRNSKDRFKQGQTKASLSLQHFLGVESGFTLDKESNTIAIICQDVTVVLAFDTRERLIQWQVKINNNLGDDQQFLIQIQSAPPKTKLTPGPARLHIQDRRFCMTSGVPPRLSGQWEIHHLRKYGVVDTGRFCFEGGSRCGKGEGLFILITDQAEELSRTFKLAAEGKIASKRRTISRNMSVLESPRKVLNTNGDFRLSDMNGGEESIWPSTETRPPTSDYGDTTSVTDYGGHGHGRVAASAFTNDMTGY